VSQAQLIKQAVAAILPLCIAVFPWGLLTGALAIQAGFSALQAAFMSVLVFAGAAQLSAISMFCSASSGSILASTFVISSRHLLYSMVLRQHVRELPFAWRFSLGFLLTDESFAVSQAHTHKTGAFSPLFALVAGLTFWLFWNMATLLGIYLGASSVGYGLDFAIVATFIAMTFCDVRRRPVLVAIIVSAVAALILNSFFKETYIIIASLLGMGAAYLFDTRPFGDESASSVQVKGEME